ncbi:MAG: hypothetical protein R3B84_02615 [Zavarzinella sp.]
MVPYKDFTVHPEDLRWGLVAASIIDTVLCRNPLTRYHTYRPNFLPGLDIGKIDHGSGDEVVCFFDEQHGFLLKGFDHVSSMSPHNRDEFQVWPGIMDEVPSGLLALLEIEEFCREETTFCIWRTKADNQWWQGDVDDSDDGEWSSYLLQSHAFTDAKSYLDWAREYYTRKDIPAGPVEAIFASCQVDEAVVRAINSSVDVDMIRNELAKLGVTLR